MGALEQMGSHLGGQPAGDLAHRRQQRQAAVLQLHRFVGDAGSAGAQQRFTHLGIGG